MKELVRSNPGELVKIIFNIFSRQSDGRAVGVLHASPARRVGDVINKQVALKRTVVDPSARRRNNSLNGWHDFLENLSSVAGIDDDAIFSARACKIAFLKCADLD